MKINNIPNLVFGRKMKPNISTSATILIRKGSSLAD